MNMLNNALSKSLVASALGLIFAANAWAAPVNGGFETGDLSGWTSTFEVGAVGSTLLAPIRGAYSALLVTPADRRQASCTLGDPSDLFAPDPWNTGCPLPMRLIASNGPPGPVLAHAFPDKSSFDATSIGFNPRSPVQYIGQDIVFNANEGVNFEWRWLTSENFLPCPIARATGDHALAFITNGTSIVGLNPTCQGPVPVDASEFLLASLLAPATIRAPAPGLWTLYFAVAQGDDTLKASALLVDNVSVVQIVPAPGTLALTASALVLLAMGRRRARAAHPKPRPTATRLASAS